MLLIGHTIEEKLIARDTVVFCLQQLGFVLNLQKSVLTPTQRIQFLGAAFINHDPVSIREKSLKSSEAVSGTSSENTSVNFRINKTNRLIVFNHSSSTSSTNKFRYLQQQQMQAFKTQ